MGAAPRLLAITPPHGPLDPGIVDAWQSGGARGLALVLRRPGASVRDQLADPQLQGLAARARDAGLDVLVSCAPDDVEGPGLAAAASMAGIQFRDGVDRATIVAARAAGLRLIGASVHGPPAADRPPTDFVVLAPVFAPRTADPRGRAKHPVGLDALAAWARGPTPVLALGGIDATTARAAVVAGAYGLAAIRSFFGPSAEVRDNVGAFMRALWRV